LWGLVFDEKGATFEKLTTAVLALITEVKFSCGPLLKVTVKGEVLCLTLNPTAKSKTHEGHCTGSGDNWCKEDKNERCEGLTRPLLDVIVNGVLVEGEELGLGLAKTEEEVFADV